MPPRVIPDPIVLSKQDIIDANVDGVTSASSGEYIEDMGEQLSRAGESLEDAGKDAAAAVLIMLSVVSDFSLNLDYPKDALRSPGHFGAMKFRVQKTFLTGIWTCSTLFIRTLTMRS